MKKTLILFVSALMLFSSHSLPAQTKQQTRQPEKKILDRTVRPLPAPAPAINIGKYESFQLENGLKVFVVENHKIPRVSYSLIVDYTPVQEGELTGLSDITGEMLRKGTKNLTKDQLDEEIDFIGASLSTNSNGMYASALRKHNNRLLELMSDVLLNPAFLPEELDKVKLQTISGLEAEKNEPAAISERVGKLLVYGPNHPYGESMSEKTVNNLTADQCRGFYESFFRPQISYLAIVGDITLAEAKTLVEKYFGSWQQGQVPTPVIAMPAMPEKNVIAIVDRPDAVQSTLSVSYPVDFKPGTPDAIKARVTNTILGGGTFRLFNNLREKHAYTYGAYSRLSSDKLIGQFSASAEVRNSVTDSATNEILSEMKRIRNEEVPADELNLVKNYLSGAFALSLEEPQTVANFAINTARYSLAPDYYVNYLKNLSLVSAQDVKEMADKYIKPDQAYILAVGKASEIAPKLEKFLVPGSKLRYFDAEGKEYDPNNKTLPAPESMNAEMVNKKYIDAIGGEKALKKIKDVTLMASTTMQGMTIGFDIYRKAPDKYMMKIGSGSMVFQQIAYDGTTGRMVSPMGGENKTLEGQELEDMKVESTLNAELFYDQLGIKLNLLGIEELNGIRAYKVELTYPSGKQATRYFDENSGLLIQESSDQGVTEFSDYRAVNGVKFPFIISQQMGQQTVKMNVLSVKVNSKLKDDIFILK